jgi:hypothetical protein
MAALARDQDPRRLRIGELSRELKKGHKVGQGNQVQIPTNGKLKSEVLKAAHISTSTANRYEELAKIPKKELEDVMCRSFGKGPLSPCRLQ